MAFFFVSHAIGRAVWESLVEPHLKAEEVKVVTIYPTRRFLEPRVRRFIDLMVEVLGGR